MPTTPTVALCMIAKDKADIITRALDSTKAMFDVYCLQDTGSSDNTVEVFEDWCKKNKRKFVTSKKQLDVDYRAVEVDGKSTLAEFNKARNDSFALIPDGIDYAFWIDTDDVIVGVEQLPSLLNAAAHGGIDAVLAVYDYAKPINGLRPVTQVRERLISLKKKGSWQNWVHENYAFAEPAKMSFMHDLGLSLHILHQRTAYEAAATNRRNHLIMKRQLDEVGIDNFSDEMVNHMAFDYWEHREYKESIELYKILLQRYSVKQVPTEQLFHVSTKVATAYLKLGQSNEAISFAFDAISVQPKVADGYLLMAEIYSAIGHWDEVEHYADKVLKLGKPNTTAPINEYDYYVTPRILKVQAVSSRGDTVRALELLRELVSILPGNTQVRGDYNNLYKHHRKSRAIAAFGELSLYLQENNLADMYERLRQAMPLELLENDMVRTKIKELKYDEKHKLKGFKFESGYSKSIIVFAGQGYEHWDGNSDIEKGIGGSEGMCIQICRELAKLGNKVFVYNDCGASDGKIFDGVTYIDFRKWNHSIKSDIFISLRRPDVFSGLIKARKTYLWLHDTDYGEVPLSNLYAPNKVIVLSDFHKTVIKQNHGIVDDSAFWITRNAINKAAVEYADRQAKARNPYQLIYASSYDRGLENLLAMWPRIKSAVPDAELIIRYGWVTYDRMMEMAHRSGDMQRAAQMQAFKSKVIDMIAKSDGVRELGRTSQNELYKEFKESSLWVYPTEFQEISCITAMTAQAMGAVPVCTPFAALNETVNSKYGVKAEMDKIADSIVFLLKNQKELEKRREPMMEWARGQFDIGILAKEWDEVFHNN